jgi:hydrogenase maturation factor
MQVVMAGSIAIGGTSVIAKCHHDKLSKRYSGSFVTDCIALEEYLDIQKASEIAGKYAVCMHSISDGGAFGAIWELASSANLGITVDIDKIPVWQETIEVAELFDYNPYLLDGTGGLLIVTENADELIYCLEEEGIICETIGEITDTKDRIAVNGDEIRYLEPPRGEILYDII